MKNVSLQASLGLTIREYREKRGLSQEAFADDVGVHRTYMGAIERGERNPTLKNLERIAAGLELKLSSLIMAAEKK